MEKNIKTTIDYAQVRWDSVLSYTKWHGAKGASHAQLDVERKKAYKGIVSEGARKRMQQACDILIQLSRVKVRYRAGKKPFPFRLGFLTLTVTGKVRDPNEVHPLFKKALDWLRYRKCLYVWKAEYQQRGQVHYHLIINQYIPWQDIKAYWNKIQKQAGYLQEFGREYGHFQPNSVDIRSVKNAKTLGNYLLKYLMKDNKIPANGHLKKWWGASQSLLEKRFEYELDNPSYDKLMQSKDIYIDEEKRFLVARGSVKELLTNYQQSAYAKWKVTRIQNTPTPPKISVNVTTIEPTQTKTKRQEFRQIGIFKAEDL